jgi:hypothetical protein
VESCPQPIGASLSSPAINGRTCPPACWAKRFEGQLFAAGAKGPITEMSLLPPIAESQWDAHQ